MTQRELANTFTDQPTTVGSVQMPRWGRIGKWLGWRRKMELSISGLPLGKVQLIAAEFSDMLGGADIENLAESEQINLLLKTNLPKLINVIGMAVCRGKQMPSGELIEAISSQLSMPQLAEAISEVYRRLDLTTFFGILALTKSLSLSSTPDQTAHGQQ